MKKEMSFLQWLAFGKNKGYYEAFVKRVLKEVKKIIDSSLSGVIK